MGQYRKFKPGHKVEGADDEFNADDRPAAMVNWHDARAFCAWLSEQPEEKKAGRVYALPTEAQWEWAARAGTTTSRHFGDTDKGQADYSWFNVTYTPNPKAEGMGRGRQPVGRLKPNAFGLYDMLGNVWEWCDDWYDAEFYRSSPKEDPRNTKEAPYRVFRGGSWRHDPRLCRPAIRDGRTPGYRYRLLGFRLAAVQE